MLLSIQSDHSSFSADTGGGALIDGDVKSAGDFVGRDKVTAQGGNVDVVVNNHPHDTSFRFVVIGTVGVVAMIVMFLVYFSLNSNRTSAPAEVAIPSLVKGPETPNPLALQDITFLYTDNPTNHGWKLTESQTITPTHPGDEHWTRVLAITSTTKYALSFAIKPEARVGTQIEAVVRLEKNALFYVETELHSKTGTATKRMWFKFKDGTPSIKPVEGKQDEWQIVVEAERLDGGWQKFQIDLDEIISKTVSGDGWKFGQLKGFRVRGNLTLAAIRVYQ